MQKPFFSIIVVAFNAEATIRQTVDSVLAQTFTDYEIIVKDAASKDATVSNLPQNEKIKLYVTADGGIYYGMNEAVGYASGKYLLFLNCGDYFASPDVLAKVYEGAKDTDESKTVLYGDYSRNGVVFKQPSRITPFYLYRTPLCHQTVFFGKGVFDKFEQYDTAYRILADYDITLKSFFGGFDYVYLPVTVSDYMGGGVSESEKMKARKKEEYAAIQKKNFSARDIRRFKRKLFFSFRGLRQKLISDRSPKWVRKLYRKLVNRVNG